MARGGREQNADDFVLHVTQPLGAAPAVTIPKQHGLGGGARREQLGLQILRRGGAENILAAGMFLGERIDRGGDPRAIDTFDGLRPVLGQDAIHKLPRYRTAPMLSRDKLT